MDHITVQYVNTSGARLKGRGVLHRDSSRNWRGTGTGEMMMALHGLVRLAVPVVFASLLFAQSDRGTITGLVSDSSGAAVPDVEIIATHTGTNIANRTTSGATGNFVLLRLPLGNYVLNATRTGFQAYRRTGIPVGVDQTTRIDIRLEVGDVKETVTITGEAPLLKSESADVSLSLNSAQSMELPLALGGAIRNPSNFIMLQPGVTANSTWEKHIAGGASFTDQIYYDGLPLMRGDASNDQEVNPSVDAIAEFKLVSNNYSAEFAHALSGITSFTYKSGSNALHGSGFAFNSIERFNARNFFQASKPPYKQNEWGGTAGGPILLPKIYDGRNRTFFFFSVDQFYRRSPGSPGLGTVPTSRMLAGDFGEWVAAGKGNIYDPATGRQNSSGQYVRDPFPNNVIPATSWSQVSKKTVALHPQPDLPGLANNYILRNSRAKHDARSSGFKIDHQLRETHRLSGMFNYTDRPTDASEPGNNTASSLYGTLANASTQRVTTRLARLSYDWILSPTVLNHVVAGVSRFRNPMYANTFGKGWVEKLGLKGVAGDMIPWVDFNHDYVRYGSWGAYDNRFTNIAFVDTLSVTRGNHILRIGFELQRQRNNFRVFDNSAGNFTFNQLSTGLAGVPKSGNAFASFLLGDVFSGYAYYPGTQFGNRNAYYSPWINDDWKVTPKLTLNLGLRWELQPAYTDPNNRLSWMDPHLPNPGAGGLPGAYVFAGDGPGRSGFTSTGETHWKDFAPRFGFAYRFAKDTVLRGGYGIFFAQENTRGIGLSSYGLTLTSGFTLRAAFNSGDNGITPAFNWDNGFPQTFQKPPIISPTVMNGLDATFQDTTRSTLVPYSQQYNLMLERQIGNTISISAGYVANLGRRLQTKNIPALDWNQVNPSRLPLGSLLQRNILDPAVKAAGFGEPFPGFAAMWGTKATLAQALRPFPQYGSVLQAGATYGLSSYHSFQFKADKRMSSGLSGTVAYTFSKYISDVASFTTTNPAPMDFYNRKLDRSLDGSDQTHILTFSYIYELPFGKGKRWLGAGFAGKALGGWKVTGIQSYSSGTPIAVSATNALPLFNPVQRPNIVANEPQLLAPANFDPARNLWLNPAAFQNPAPLTFGNAPRQLNVRTPARLWESLGILKDTPIGERYRVQLRAEATNPMNRVVFNGPTANIASASFGKIGSALDGRQIQFGLKLYF